MGSASSKAGDTKPQEFGRRSERPERVPAAPPSVYNQAQQATGSPLDGTSEGKHPQQPYFAGQHNTTEAMEVDPPTETSSEVSYADGEMTAVQMDTADVTVPPGEDVVPMCVQMEHGGRNVFITGTFNGWTSSAPCTDPHMYKFVVDDDWRSPPTSSQWQMQDDDEDPENPSTSASASFAAHYINKAPPTVDGRLLPVPQHVALNHLYCTAIKDGMMVLGITNRYKQKFVTTVYYSLMPGAN
ncbi:Immunoglobulin E-set [Phytophthora cactorum]|nr:Immunoglobulin E-set [Phytophthora cactorum]